jgi:endogenous inhibitor of DNA gyrase (YacG/DUF329 family)
MIKVHCPICNAVMQGQGPSEWPAFPFCSDRCRTIDLGRWLGEEYRVVPDPDEESPETDAHDPP